MWWVLLGWKSPWTLCQIAGLTCLSVFCFHLHSIAHLPEIGNNKPYSAQIHTQIQAMHTNWMAKSEFGGRFLLPIRINRHDFQAQTTHFVCVQQIHCVFCSHWHCILSKSWFFSLIFPHYGEILLSFGFSNEIKLLFGWSVSIVCGSYHANWFITFFLFVECFFGEIL